MGQKASNILLTRRNLRETLDSIDTILTDCDGVLWNGREPIEGAPEAIKLLKAMGKEILYVTNDSTKTRQQYAEKCCRLNYPATGDDIICAAHVTAHYIKHTLKYAGKIYILGQSGLEKELQDQGFTVIGKGSEDLNTCDINELASFKVEDDVGCVVVGTDPLFNYAKVFKATCHLSKPDCHFIGTSIDARLPMGDAVLPDCGCIVKCVEVASGRTPTVIGKPNKPMIDMAREKHNLDMARTVMIGDTLNTDIELGYNCGLRTIHVHTGFYKLEDVQKLQESADPEAKKGIPNYYIPSMGEFGKLIKEVYNNDGHF